MHHLDLLTWANVQDISFMVDLHILPLCGANLVLGVQWLKSLDPVLTDYNDLSMKFSHGERTIKLKGDSASHLHLITPP